MKTDNMKLMTSGSSGQDIRFFAAAHINIQTGKCDDQERGIIIVKLMMAGPAAFFASNMALAISEPGGAAL